MSMRSRFGILVTAGFLAFSGFTFSLRAEDAAVLVAPREIFSGGSSALTLTTFDAQTRRPVSRRAIVRLLDGNRIVAGLFDGPTGADGRVHVSFEVPDIPGGNYRFEAQVSRIEAALELDTMVSKAPAILVETDKPIYKPGQTIKGRVLLVNNSLRPVSGEVEVSFHDAKGIRIDRRSLEANEFGVAPFSLALASEVNFGTWKVKARSEDVESIRDVRVEKYTLPRFNLGASFPRSWTLVDQEVEGTVDARYFFGRAVEGTCYISASRYVGEWQEYASIEAQLEDGLLSFTLPPVDFVAGSPEDGGQGSITLDIDVTDSTGHTESISEILSVVEAPLVIGLVPRASTIKPEIVASLLVTARTPDGAPLDSSVPTTITFRDSSGQELETLQRDVAVVDGRTEISFTPPADTFYAEVEASAVRDGYQASASTQIGGSYSLGGSYLSISRSDAASPASVGQRVAFSAVATHASTIYYEVYSGGRTVLSGYTEDSDFSFTVTPEMAPKAKVVAYSLSPTNEVAADSMILEVLPGSSMEIQAAFERERVKPGDAVSVTIDTGRPGRALVGLSVVDESVLALGRSRLHLAQVFAELESRFLEPRVEVHEGGGGPEPVDGPFFGGGFGGRGPAVPSSTGALDVLEGAGLGVAASDNITVRRGMDFQLWRRDDVVDFDGGGPFPMPAPPVMAEEAAAGGEPAGAPSEAVRVRQYFPETWVWEPMLITDESGRVTVELEAPDNITGWKLSAVASSASGIGFAEAELTAFQEFFVDPSLPYDVTRGEEFPVKVDVFNYLDTDQAVTLSFGAGDWFELLGSQGATVTVPAGSAQAVYFPIRPVEIGEFNISITATGSRGADAVQRSIKVIPEGTPAEQVFNGVIEAGRVELLELSFPREAISDSERAYLHITPSPVAQTMNGISDLLQMPYGCGEQNMIFLAPDIEILKYLREVGELNPEIRAQAEYFVNTGYQKELTYQTDDGGFAAFGGAQGSLWLSAFVLSTFSGAREVRDIDEGVLARCAGMLISRQREDGSFTTDDFLIHQEMDGGLDNAYSMAAYVTRALAEYADGIEVPPSVSAAIERAAGYLVSNRRQVDRDAYPLSIAAVALLSVPGYEQAAEDIVDRLVDLAITEGTGIHWQPYSVETTGYAAMALLVSGRPQAAAAIDWLTTQRNSLGGYGGSTQDTVVAIRALFSAARTVRRDLELTLELLSGNTVLETLVVTEENFDLLHSFELALDSGPLRLRATGDGSVGFQVARKYHVPDDLLPPPRDMTIEVVYDSEGIEVDEILDATVRLNYTGAKERTGMVIADIGVPTGFAAVGSSLSALVDEGVVSRVDLAGRKVVFYLDALRRLEPVEFTFRMKALYPVRSEGPVSRVYEYYDVEVQAYHCHLPVLVTEPEVLQVSFVRGDTNGDATLDISDAVATLNYLFLGGANNRVACEDAGDVNDDGLLNITDPVYALSFLFQGGLPPAEPFPQPGFDETEDGLDCMAAQ